MKRTSIILTALFSALSAFSTEYYVDASRPDDTGSATNWVTAKKTIQAAVDLASDGDTVLVTNGVYNTGGRPAFGYALTNRVTIEKSIVVQSINGPAQTHIQGYPGSDEVFSSNAVRGVFLQGDCMLSGFTIREGHTMEWGEEEADYSGGGIWAEYGSTVTNCIITNNLSFGSGGGIQMQLGCMLSHSTICSNQTIHGDGGGVASASLVEHCTVEDNYAWNGAGGGVHLDEGGVLRDSLIRRNGALSYSGGGVDLASGSLVESSVISSNVADYAGGGVHLFYGGRVSKCEITSNKAIQDWGGGGGAELVGQNCVLENCILDSNSTGYRGGGVHLSMRALLVGEVNNCTIVNNTAKVGGGAADGPVNNCIIWNNSATNSGSNLAGVSLRYSSSPDAVAGMYGNITNAPLFADPLLGDYRLQPGSPCINAGNNTYAPSGSDLAGAPRINGIVVDMGAYEQDISLPTYQLTTIGGSSGSIYPDNPVVFEGYEKSIYLFPDVGYHINTLSVDGNPVISTNVYTFFNVQTTHTISVTFSLNSDTYYVDASRPDDSGDGITWSTAKKTIQAAVNVAGAGSTIWVTNGIYNAGGKVTPGAAQFNRVCLNDEIRVQSVNGPEVTIIQGAKGVSGTRCVFMNNGSSLIGFTATNGDTSPAGSGIYDTVGGGIWLSGSCIVSNCIITGNHATSAGAGLNFYNGGTINNSIIINNDSDQAGGGAKFSNGGTLNQCIVLNNTAGYAGGGASLYSGGTLNNCLIAGNSAASHSGGAYLYNGGILNNCIVWNNTAPSSSNISKALTGGVIRYTCAPDGVTHGVDGCTTNNPLFVDAANGEFKLQFGSPCINTGHNTYAPPSPYDLAGNLRIINGTVDMGAYEYNSSSADSNQDGVPDYWYISYGLDCTSPSVGMDDPDKDQQSTYDEFIAGFDPTNASSFFAILNFTNTPSSRLEWDGVSGRVYSVYWSTNLIDGFQTLETNIPWTAGSYTDTFHNAYNEGFYKIGVDLVQ